MGSPPPGSPVAGNSCRAFPANGYWHADVSRLPVHPRSGQWLSHMSTGVRLHPDFGPSYGEWAGLRHPGHRRVQHPPPGPGPVRVRRRERPGQLPARLRYVDHAIGFTTDLTSRHHVWPARHDAGATDSLAYPPMGARFRLERSFPTTGYGPPAKAVITAMKRYCLVLADNGSPWFFQGEQNAAWPERLVSDLKRIPASAFVADDTRGLRVSGSSARVR